MSLLPFLILTINLFFIYKGMHKAAVITFIINIIVSTLIFHYHITDTININL
jgi:hypothetical protein